jgi:GcrA cell cycle regulator
MSRGRVDRRGEGWTPENVASLLSLLAEGKSHAEAAVILDRSISSIKSKVGYLNHPRKKPGAEPRENTWTADRVATLVKLWGEGKSAKQIADALDISRNSAIGRVHRMGLTRNANAVLTPAQKGAHRMTMPKPKVVKIKAPKPPPKVKPEPIHFEAPKLSVLTGVRLQHGSGMPPRAPAPKEAVWRPLLGTTPKPFGTERVCKWPIELEEPTDFLCCGQPKDDGVPYCPAHQRVAGIAPKTSAKQLERSLRRWAA